jgi:hypothetical protein
VVEESFLSLVHDSDKEVQQVDDTLNAIILRKQLRLCEDNENREEAIIKFLCGTNPYLMFHENSPYLMWRFRSFLYYHHLDYRKFVPYQRETHENIMNDGFKAEQLVRKSDKHIHGVKRRWYFYAINYIRIDRGISYDPFHVLANNVKYVFMLMLGLRTMKESTIEFCKNTNSHPLIWSSVQPPWQLIDIPRGCIVREKIKKSRVIKEIDKYLSAVHLPPNCGDSHEVRDFLVNFGQKKGIQKIHFMECSMEYLVQIIKMCMRRKIIENYPQEYLLYYCMLSSLFGKLLSPIFLDHEIDDLYNKTVEVVALSEGLFPPSELVMIKHQLIDLVYFIRNCGPLKGWWTLPAERALSAIKTKVQKGGSSFYKTVSLREYESQTLDLNNLYDTENIETLVNDNDDIHTVVENHESSSDKYKYNVQYTYFAYNLLPNSRNIIKCINLNDHDKDILINIMVDELDLFVNNKLKLFTISPLYRLYIFYRRSKEQFTIKKNNESLSLYEFLVFLCSEGWENLCVKNKLVLETDPSKPEEIVTHDGELIYGIYRKDKKFIHYIVKNFGKDIKIYDKAKILGTKFSSRGFGFREYNDSNQLSDANVTMTKKHISSWCKVYNPCEQQYADYYDPNVDIGQINTFFYINLPDENLLHGLPIASITYHKALKPILGTDSFTDKGEKHKNKENFYFETLVKVKCNTNDIKDHYSGFVFLYNIYAHPLAVAAVDADNKAIPGLKSSCKNVNQQQTIIDTLYLFPVHRNKCCFHDNESLRKHYHPYSHDEDLDKLIIKLSKFKCRKNSDL